jgi:hypothetical protein
MNRIVIALTATVTALGLGGLPSVTLAQQAATPVKHQAGMSLSPAF